MKKIYKKMRLKKMKEVLVVIDMVKGFVDEGNLSDPEIGKIADEIVSIVEKFLDDENKDIIAFKDVHDYDSKELKTFPEHCIRGSVETELIDKLMPYEKAMKVFEKNSTCGFVTKKFMKYLKKNKYKINKFVVVGCCTDICVANFTIPLINYINEYNLDIDVEVILDAIETFNNELHNREEYNELGVKMMRLNGITLKKKYGE